MKPERTPFAPRQRGVSLIELMVGVVIGLIAVLVIYQTFAVAEGVKRQTISAGDAQKTGMIATYLLGAELSLFVTWNLSTLGGGLIGGAIPDPTKLGLDLVFPLAFLALLVPLVRTRVELVVALFSGALAYVVAQMSSGGVPIVVTGVGGSLLGAWLTRGRPVEQARLEDAIREVA